MKHRYSPLPMGGYRYGDLKEHEIDVIGRSTCPTQIWNLYWLSTPTLDAVPGSGTDWWKYHQPRVGALSSVILDVIANDDLRQHLLGHPQTFAEWFEREDHTLYDTWSLLGQRAWVDNVMSRAQASADRLLQSRPPVSIRDNVIRVNFRRAA